MVKSVIKAFGSQSFLIGLGVAAASYFLAPQLKKSLRPAAVKGAQGVMAFGSMTKDRMNQGKEKLNEIISQKGETLSNATAGAAGVSVMDMVLKELKEEREQSNRILEELKNSISGLKEEISNMKNAGSPQEG